MVDGYHSRSILYYHSLDGGLTSLLNISKVGDGTGYVTVWEATRSFLYDREICENSFENCIFIVLK